MQPFHTAQSAQGYAHFYFHFKYNERIIVMRKVLFILTLIIYQCGFVVAQTIYASGTVRYYDAQLLVWKPLVGVEVKQLNGPPSYTDANGQYSVPVGSNWIVPDQVTVYVFLEINISTCEEQLLQGQIHDLPPNG